MEKTLRRLVISPRPFTEKQVAERERMAEFISIPGVVKVVNEYRHVPDILKKLKLEQNSGGTDLDEDSIKAAINEPNYHNVHLFLTTVEWRNLGIRMNLYGQAQEIDGQGITYGRKGDHLRYYTSDIKEALTDITLVEWHELDHTLRALWGVDPTSTHYHFYGYAKQYENMPKTIQNQVKPRRWVRKPDPLEGWRALPWERLDVEEKANDEAVKKSLLAILLQLIPLLQQLLIAKQKQLVKPLRAWGQNVSQPYGEYNPSLYPLTQHHIGVDHAVPKGTPIYAPADGHIVEAGYNDILGHYFVYEYKADRWLAALHLANHPDPGTPFKAGEEIAVVGNTGFIKGIHSHLEVWKTKPNRAQVSSTINKDNWQTVTVDPLKEF